MWLLVTFCAVLGLLIGSFLNVVIYRVPRGESVVKPRSRCPGCGNEIAPRDNVPVVSWLILRGRCRHCAEPISIRYPLVELLTAVVFATMALRFGFEAELPAYLYLAAVGVALAMIDIDVKRLPNALTYPSYPIAVILLGAASLAHSDAWSFVRTLIGMVALAVFFFILVVIYPKGMGLGDVKLAGILGAYLAWIGWGALVVGGFMGFFIGGIAGIGLMLFAGASRKSKIPFGPYMLAGALVGILWGQSLATGYINTFSG